MVEDNKTKSFVATIKNKKNLPVILGILFLVLIVAIFLAVYLNTSKKENEDKGKVVFSISGKEFYESDVDKLIAFPVKEGNMTESSATQTVFEKYKTIVIAENLGLNLPESVVSPYLSDLLAGRNIDKNSEYMPWFELLAKYQAIENNIGRDSSGTYRGYAHVFYFGQHIEYEEGSPPEGARNPDIIAQDRAYAKEKAEYYYQQIKDGKISDEELDKVIKGDSKLANIVSVVNPFGAQNAANWRDDVYYNDIIEYVKANGNNKGLSPLLVGSAKPEPVVSFDDAEVELYYYFVNTTDASEVKFVTQQQLTDEMNKAEILYYGEYDPSSDYIEADNIESTFSSEPRSDVEGL